MSSDGFMSCSCKKFECFGLGCSHILAVFASMKLPTIMAEYEPTDVAILWWNVYANATVDEDCPLWRSLRKLRQNDISGPRMPKYEDVLKIHPQTKPITTFTGKFGCLNYSEQHIIQSQNQYGGFTQSTNVRQIGTFELDDDCEPTTECAGVGIFESDDDCEPTTECAGEILQNESLPLQSDDDCVDAAGNSYSQLYGYFQHLVSNMDLLNTETHQKELKFWKNLMNEKSATYKKTDCVDSSAGLMVSTNVVHVKKQKLISKFCF